MTVTAIAPPTKVRYWNSAGTAPLSGGKVYFYEADGSYTTPKDTYSDYDASTPNTNPVILDANGEASIRLDGIYDVKVFDASDVLQHSVLNYLGANDASEIPYTPAGTGAVATDVQTKLRESVSVKDFGAVGDGIADDTTAIQAAIDYAVTNSKIVYVPTGLYKITTTLRSTTTSSNFGMVGDGYDLTKFICYFTVTNSALKFFNKTNFKLSGFSVDGRYSSGSTVSQGVDCAIITNGIIEDIIVNDVEGQGIWCISADYQIRNFNVHMTRLKAMNCGSSGIQLQGASESGISKSTAKDCGSLYATNGGSGSGVYMKVPLEDCYHSDNTADGVTVGAFNVGSSFVGVKAKRLTWTNGRAVNCKRGIRIGEVEDSVFSNFVLDLDGTNTDGLGDAVRLEDGALNNSFKNISVSGVGASRAGARILDGAVGNIVELTSFKNPTAGAIVASFGNTSTDNIVEVTNNKSSSIEAQYGTDTSNIYRRKGVVNTQQKTISSGVISLEDREMRYIVVDTEASASADDLDSINGAQYDGQMVTITTYSDVRDVTIKDSVGNIQLNGDMVLDRAADTITLMWVDRVSMWCEISRSNNLA